MPQDWAFLAMAHQQKGNREEARRWLDRLCPASRQRRPVSQPTSWNTGCCSKRPRPSARRILHGALEPARGVSLEDRRGRPTQVERGRPSRTPARRHQHPAIISFQRSCDICPRLIASVRAVAHHLGSFSRIFARWFPIGHRAKAFALATHVATALSEPRGCTMEDREDSSKLAGESSGEPLPLESPEPERPAPGAGLARPARGFVRFLYSSNPFYILERRPGLRRTQDVVWLARASLADVGTALWPGGLHTLDGGDGVLS